MGQAIAVKPWIRTFLRRLGKSALGLLPIVLVIVAFQLLVLRQPIPDLATTLLGGAFVLLGMMFFVQGLEMGLFPIGETMAYRTGLGASASSFCASCTTFAQPGKSRSGREYSGSREISARAGVVMVIPR